jgi:hypothetical protein
MDALLACLPLYMLVCDVQEEYLPVVQGRTVATGSKEDILIIRDLLTSHGV